MNDDVRRGPVRRGHDEQPRWHGLEPADELLRRSRDILDIVATLTGEPGLATETGPRDLHSAESALRAAEHVALRKLAAWGDAGGGSAGGQLAATLALLSGTLAAIRDSRLNARSAAITDLHRCLSRLRAATSLEDLVEQVPVEINRLGYKRSLFCRLSGPNWSPRSAFVHADSQLAHDLVRLGTAIPGQLGRELPETEVVRKRTPVLVEDAQHNPGVHHRLINLARTRDYVVAPLVGHGEVVGLLHADQQVDTDRVDEFDRRLLGLFAEGLGCVFERLVCFEQLDGIRRQLQDQARSVGDLINGYLGCDVPAPRPEQSRPDDPLRRFEGPFAELTRRELEVLRHLVCGETNSQIAAELFVSPGTVKTHVKNVLRKLGVANRAEATARYHAVMQRSR
ncbi:LuxR C-terminal-related transcriptional regulator [Streptomyces sp. RB6PN25]|uniref:LuxR C-terminal-related transcriptional regulator n=1 Tax=Streptomyces humicola TaxID=2953240 RepID=A0ABT1PNE5_9ACTN|nr:LuxR C-terminal-related transcriptional regulator [Streptomyces humicola]MCQ4079194.1 LuxR C-terminal-related transcriptional regulator [Streptomyces humicola]